MRYVSIIFASMLLVGCAQSTDVDSTQDVDIQSQEQTTEPEVDTQEEQTETQPEETTEDSIEADESTEELNAETNTTETESRETESRETESTETESTETSGSDTQETEQAAEPEPAPEPEPEPAPEPVEEAEPEPTGFTLAMVQENDDASSCWSVINGNVYDLTAWINQHPGGSSRILGLCGTDGSSSFNSMHGGQSNPESRLQSFLLGPLS